MRLSTRIVRGGIGAVLALALAAGAGLGAIALVPPAWCAASKQATAAGTPTPASQAQESASRSAPIDINTAGADRLSELPGVGPAIAQRIVDYRKEHGPYKSVEDLLNVRGIGERSLARFRDRVSVGGKG